MTKTVQFLMKICGGVLVLLGAACLVAGNWEKLRSLLPCCKKSAEFQNYADVD